MVVGDAVKFDSDAVTLSPPNHCVMSENGHVLPRRDEKESDLHTRDDRNRIFNPTTISGKIQPSDDMRPLVISNEGSREVDVESLTAALDHFRSHTNEGFVMLHMQCRQPQRRIPRLCEVFC